ncbi:hypothetical protein RAMLITH_17470, partial [Ramlibacter sp. RBP-2]|nr:hypothetical protein [Ramlibacter lithotrophicus]
HAHVDHSCFPCSFPEQASVYTWVSFGRSRPSKVGQFSVIINSRFYLQAANPDYSDIFPEGELEILGVVVGQCRTYRR